MRKGYRPSLMLDDKGEIFAVATGSDATSEHEWGSRSLMLELTGQEPRKADATAAELKRTGSRTVPSVLDGRTICRDLEHIVFELGEDGGEPAAALGYTARAGELSLLAHRELQLNAFSEPKHLAGAWDESSFAFKVRGADLVEKLKRFHQSVLAGNGMFAGLFLTGERHLPLGGVIVCDSTRLTDLHRHEMDLAQKKFEESVFLAMESREEELKALARTAFAGTRLDLGFLKANHRDAATGEIRYWLNPAYGMDQGNFGSHGFEALARWIQSGAKGLIKETVA